MFSRSAERGTPPPASPPPPLARTWKRRLQKFSLRTKLVVPMVVLAVLQGVLGGGMGVLRMKDALRDSTLERIAFDATSKARNLQEILDAAREDAALLSQFGKLADIDPPADGTLGLAGAAQRRVSEELALFSRIRSAYCGIRYIMGDGAEPWGIDGGDDRPGLAAKQAGRTAGDEEAWKRCPRRPGEIAIVMRDVVNGAVVGTAPHADVVRFVAPVARPDARLRACVAISLCADHLLRAAGTLPAGAEAWLVDADGRYLGYRGPSEAKRELYAWERRRNLQDDLGSAEAAAILGSGIGPRTREWSESFLSSYRIRGPQEPGLGWTLLIASPRDSVAAPPRSLTRSMSMLLAITVLIAALLGTFVAVYVTHPILKLRQATRRIARGDQSQAVDISTGDEIEELARDFNTMVGRLQDAQGRLRLWNDRLESELRRQRESLHALESGLARVDKLASLGQMTATVLHEIGNPLAAIKTALQVAEESGKLCTGCRPLAAIVLGEVDRLSGFLRSFARVARHPQPQMRDVSLADVIGGTVALLEPALRRRRMVLRVRADENLLTVRGDADQLRHLLINLVLNAAEATPGPGEVVIEVLNAPNHRIIMAVSDRGSGIPAHLADRIWDPFFTTKPEGSGLGLAICRRIAADHRATIAAAARDGGGTTVAVTLPGLATPAGENAR